MSGNVTLEITDICDELSEDLRRQLMENKVISVSQLNANRNQFIELNEENLRLKSNVMFANKCLKTSLKYKIFLNEIQTKIENVLDLKEKQFLNDLEIEYKNLFKNCNENNEIELQIETKNDIIEEVVEDITNTNNEYLFDNENNWFYNFVFNNTNEDFLNDNNIIEDIIEIQLKEEEECLQFNEEINQISVQNRVLNSTNDENSKELIKSKSGFICPIKRCNSVFKFREQLDSHLLYSMSHRRLRFDRKLKYGCKECSFRCDSLNWLTLHRNYHLMIQQKCRICSKIFTSAKNLSKHLKVFHTYGSQRLSEKISDDLKELIISQFKSGFNAREVSQMFGLRYEKISPIFRKYKKSHFKPNSVSCTSPEP